MRQFFSPERMALARRLCSECVSLSAAVLMTLASALTPFEARAGVITQYQARRNRDGCVE